MRHIPEDELHSYLDQALSRSQCVEIERHLARCGRCQMERDSIAALRDRTTALLARVGPPPIIPPAFDTLMARAAVREQRSWRWLKVGSWAASIGGVLFFGWWMSGQVFRVEPRQSIAVAPTVAPATDGPKIQTVPAPAAPVAKPVVNRKPKPVRTPPQLQLVRASTPIGDQAPAANGIARVDEIDAHSTYQPSTGGEQIIAGGVQPLELSDLVAQPVADDPGLNGLWRTIVPDKETNDRRGDIALVPGLPVIQMRVQPGSAGDDVTAVDQTLESGDMIRTISGPATRVLALVNEEADADSVSHAASTNPHMTVTIRQADRMVAVTGPANALGSLLARVNMKSTKRRY